MRVFFFGDIAQLVERLNGIEKVRGSTPLISTIPNPILSLFCWVFIISGSLLHFIGIQQTYNIKSADCDCET